MAKNKQQFSNKETLDIMNDKLDNILKSIEKQDKRIETLVNSLQEQLKLGRELESLKSENQTIKAKLKEIEIAVRKNAMEKNNKKIELSGIPKQENESLDQIICNVSSALSIPISNSDIKDIYRRKDTMKGSGSIIFKLKTVQQRNSILKAAKEKKLSTDNLGFKGPNKKVYLNVPLIPETRKLYYLAKQAQALKGWYRIWIYGGEVYMRIEEKGKPIRIQTMEDINTLLQ